MHLINEFIYIQNYLFTDALEYIVTVTGEEGNINEPAEGGATALHYAVSGGHEDCVRVLLQFGADINSITTTEEVSNILTSVYDNIHDIVLPSVVSLSLSFFNLYVMFVIS